jgi:hypothetical protein
MTQQKVGQILYDNRAPMADITVTSAAEGFGAEYLVNNNQGVIWRSADTTPQTITLSFLEDETPVPLWVKGLVILNHNLEGSDTVTLQGSDSISFPEPVEEMTITPDSGFWVEYEDGGSTVGFTQAFPYYRITITKNVAADYIQVGEIYLGGSLCTFDRNYNWNYTYTREINRNTLQTTSGQVYRKTRFTRRGFNLDFSGITDTQKSEFEDVADSDYICFLPHGDTGEMYYGYIDFSSFTHAYNNYWNAGVSFMENPK